jgi:hypothetical protein
MKFFGAGLLIYSLSEDHNNRRYQKKLLNIYHCMISEIFIDTTPTNCSSSY